MFKSGSIFWAKYGKDNVIGLFIRHFQVSGIANPSPPRPRPRRREKFCPRPVPELRGRVGTNLWTPRGQFALPRPALSPNFGAGDGDPRGSRPQSPTLIDMYLQTYKTLTYASLLKYYDKFCPCCYQWQNSRDRIVVSTLRCGRSNPGSNPGHGSDHSLIRHVVLFYCLT